MQDQAKKFAGFTGAMIADMCQMDPVVRYAIPKRYELLLPRFRLEPTGPSYEAKRLRWMVECWWRSISDGALGYYVKIDLITRSVWKFRELPGDITVPAMSISDAEMSYLDQCAMPWKIEPDAEERAAELDEMWQSLVPVQLKEYALRQPRSQTFESYLLPLEDLTAWNWEILRDLLLKRENTTVEALRDYAEYKCSGSDKRYIAPEHRAEAKALGLRFWRDENDI